MRWVILPLTPETTITFGFTAGMRVKVFIVSLGHAFRLCTIPTGQSVYYGHLRESVFGYPLNEIVWIVIAGALLARLCVEIGCRRLIFGMGVFLLTFFPVSNSPFFARVLVAERTLYFPSLSICLLAASLAEHLYNGIVSKQLTQGLFVAILIAYVVTTLTVVGYWKDEQTLWRTTIQSHPRSPTAQLKLGQAMVIRWQSPRTHPLEEPLRLACFVTALSLNPSSADALIGQGIVARDRRSDVGRAILPRGRRHEPQRSEDHRNTPSLLGRNPR